MNVTSEVGEFFTKALPTVVAIMYCSSGGFRDFCYCGCSKVYNYLKGVEYEEAIKETKTDTNNR